ncbi:MAG: hypothetical protein NT129_05875 [Candidatus Aenigmarchaeota archaeon]|nr:hypothetical protein [Candidatus Aenigmarchaeota archaeon]
MKLTENRYHILIFAIFVIALFSTANSFNSGYIASWDGPAHIVRAEHFFNSLNLDALGVWGWYHGWYLGVAPFIFYSPGFFIIVSIIKIISFGFLPTDLIINILLALTYALFPVTLYWLSTELGFSKRTSILAGILSLGFSAIWGIGLSGIYAIGLYTNIFSLLPFMLFLGVLHKTLTEKGSTVVTGLLLGFIIITNIVTAVYAVLAVFIYIISLLTSGKKVEWIKILQLFMIGTLVSLFWIITFLISIPLIGIETAFAPFGLVELLKALFLGEIIFHPIISIFLTLGLCFFLWNVYKDRSKSFKYIFLTLLFSVTVLVASNLLTNLTSSWVNSGEITEMISRVLRSILRTRSLAFLWILVPIIGAVGINSILEIFGKHLRKKISDKVIVFAMFLLFLFSSAQLLDLAEKNVKTTSHADYKTVYNEWDASFRWLKNNAENNSIVLTKINWDKFEPIGANSIDSLINLESGLRTVNGNQIESSQLNTWYLNDMDFKETEKDILELHKFNVGYIISYRNPEYNVSYLEKIYSSKNIIIYKTINLRGPYEIINYILGPNTYYFKMYVLMNGSIELPVQYNNHWHAEVNGDGVEVKRSEYGLIGLNLKSGVNDIKLVFRLTSAEIIALAISLLTFIISIIYLCLDRMGLINKIYKKIKKVGIFINLKTVLY